MSIGDRFVRSSLTSLPFVLGGATTILLGTTIQTWIVASLLIIFIDLLITKAVSR